MFRIGCHISSAGGYLAMAKRAEALGANTFAFFTRNPRGGSAKPIEETDIAAFHAECARVGIDRLVAHAPYTLNPCAAKANVAEFARMAFSDDLQRMEHTPGQFYNFDHDRPARDHGRQRQRGRRPLRGAARHH